MPTISERVRNAIALSVRWIRRMSGRSCSRPFGNGTGGMHNPLPFRVMTGTDPEPITREGRAWSPLLAWRKKE